MSDFETLIAPDLFHWEQVQHIIDDHAIEDKAFIERLQRLALASSYACAQIGKYPQILDALGQCESFDLDTDALQQRLAQTSDIDDIKHLLRLFRHHKLLQIIYLDCCCGEPVRATLRHLSDLADALIQQALIKAEDILAAKHGRPVDQQGEPMQLNIIGMGKLGGRELNFSSDIDLICSFAEDGQLKGFGQLSYKQFFTNVVRLFSQFLNDSTADGFVYRVDLRLRPWGDSGPVVLSHSSFEHYYQLHGREWEQYAMVKARVITGSEQDRAHLDSIIKPFVYRRYHDYRVFDGLAQMKRRIDQQAMKKRERHNIKTGRGGIREIEFFVQAFQILKGGRNHHLQTPSLYQAIDTLGEQQITDQPTLSSMHQAYDFLRWLENRIQMIGDQQTHDLPEQHNYRERIAWLGGYDDWEQLVAQLSRHQKAVSEIFATLFTQDQSEQSRVTATVLDELDEETHYNSIAALGFNDPGAVHRILREFYQSKALIYMSDKAKQRFRCFFPALLQLVCGHHAELPLLQKMLALLSSIAGRSVYFELLYQNMPLMLKLVDLFDSSNWIAEEVTRHPILLESILYPQQLEQRFSQEMLRQALSVQLENVAGDEEMELDVLRQFKREQTIVIASAEIAESIGTEEVSRYLSELAEILLQAVYDLSLDALQQQYGSPQCLIDDELLSPGMGIIAYGKLGGYELHYQSDLDIIFLHNSSGKRQQTNGDRAIDNATFFSRLAQKVISKITLLTAAGKLYEIDTRLRPDGASGLLVSPLSAFHSYQRDKAWVWEHQAITRARYIAGDARLADAFQHTRLSVLQQPREPANLAREILEMRDKMYQAQNPPEGEFINIKHSRGCMVDVEFMVQYLVLLHSNKFASLTQTTDNIGLINELLRLGLVSNDFGQLAHSYRNFHRWLHTRVLQNQSADIESRLVRDDIDQVLLCWNQVFQNQA